MKTAEKREKRGEGAIKLPRNPCRASASPRFNSFNSFNPFNHSLAFTMIEIAISLAVIGFALVAIIGILPAGMNVQKENREDTIINADASIWMDVIRGGQKGFDDLTNYVLSVTNMSWYLESAGSKPTDSPQIVDWYTPEDSSISPKFPLTNGLRIVGLLSTPKFRVDTNRPGAYYSNYVVANVRSMSGAASEKYPQNNPSAQDFALSYRLVPEILPYDGFQFNGTMPGYYDPHWTNYLEQTLWKPTTNWPEIIARSNTWRVAINLHSNMCDVRLIFRWPLITIGKTVTPNNPLRRQVFRTTVGGFLNYTNDPYVAVPNLYFFQPRTYYTVTNT